MKTLTQDKFLEKLLKDKKKFKQFTLKIEDRNPDWNYGIHNHAEFVNYMNPHDNYLWDALIPGYKNKIKPNTLYKLQNVIGIYMLKNRNHKIVCKIYKKGYNSKQAEKETHTYMKRYYKKHNLKHAWIQISSF